MRSMKTKSYILVTPAKNEENNLPLLAKSIINQSIRPRLWVIVNDNSTDNTGKIIKELESQHEWIIGVDLNEPGEYDAIFRNAITYRAGLKMALEYTKENHMPFGYVGIVDADFVLERRFFEKLIKKFIENPRLGMASGGVYVLKKNKLVWERSNPKFPRGSPRLIRFECFFDIGGYPAEPAPDLFSYYLARIKGWETLQVKSAIGVELRPTGGRDGILNRSKKQGFINFYLGVSPLSALLRAMFMALFESPLKAFGFLEGYFLVNISLGGPLPRKVVEFARQDMSIKQNFFKVMHMWRVFDE
ncbi:glycosyltransferase family 2 protein [Thermococcus sp. ES12]|uniref:glycosyltransferase n=1 Tax=Thermococcus sp. ES12 TaxID=1638246 RepID=UPI001F0FDFC9|nr:glycosyltransferase family A protein [Thermococcus sp. ES12]